MSDTKGSEINDDESSTDSTVNLLMKRNELLTKVLLDKFEEGPKKKFRELKDSKKSLKDLQEALKKKKNSAVSDCVDLKKKAFNLQNLKKIVKIKKFYFNWSELEKKYPNLNRQEIQKELSDGNSSK